MARRKNHGDSPTRQAAESDIKQSGFGENDPKLDDLAKNTENSAGEFLTTNQGVRIRDNQNSLKAGDRGPTLMEDFIFREKLTHFDHERIPERVVHARGAGAHGHFQVYESMEKHTRAAFLQDPSVKTPVFVRFSTVAGSRGSSDLARDVRGFAVKFYTQEGNFDLVGNNMPVFFIQDAIKFPDFIHAVKPEPHNEIPQAASAHDTFWDFVSLTPESMHMIMWVMSDRAIPRSLRMMEGFGIHTFRFVNAAGKARFVKFHWKPLLGMHSVAWAEAQKISGCDPDFHRRDLWESIEDGHFPEWELGVQIVEERDEHKFDFDLLDPTKLIPEELVPVQLIGRLTLDRNPENFFAETEQVAFHVGNVIPGIDFTNDPLMQGRLFSYTDTQLIRLGGPNFHELPINRPIAPVHNNQRDGYMRQTVNRGRTSYEPNRLAGGCPFQAGVDMSGFASYAEKVDAQKVRERSPSFMDHFTQPRLFFQSQSLPEQNHIVNALRFELGKVETTSIRERMLTLLAHIDRNLANAVAEGLGLGLPSNPEKLLNVNVPADVDPRKYQSKRATGEITPSPALSMANTRKDSVQTRKIAFLVADGFDDDAVMGMKMALTTAGAAAKIVAPRLGMLNGAGGQSINADFSLLTAASVLFDAVYVPGGDASIAELLTHPEAGEFLNEAFGHCKAICALGEGVELLTRCPRIANNAEPAGKQGRARAGGIIASRDATARQVSNDFIADIARHRYWEREAGPLTKRPS
jgi:catalase